MNLAIITGTTRGLGKALTEQFRSDLWTVFELSRPAFTLERAGELAPPIMERASHFSVERAILVNNAAGLHIEPAATQTLDAIRADLEANVIGPVLLMSAFLKAFPKGEIINITSGVVATDVDGWSLYATAKAAVSRYVQALASEGHTASNFDPGVIDTDMQGSVRAAKFRGVEDFDRLKSRGLLKPARDVAETLVASVG